MLAVFADKERIGSIAAFAGHPRARRWVAYSIYSAGKPEAFPTKRDAFGWLKKLHTERQVIAEQERGYMRSRIHV